MVELRRLDEAEVNNGRGPVEIFSMGSSGCTPGKHGSV